MYTRIYVHLAHIQYSIHFLNIIQRSSTLTFTFLLYYYLRGRQYGLYERSWFTINLQIFIVYACSYRLRNISFAVCPPMRLQKQKRKIWDLTWHE